MTTAQTALEHREWDYVIVGAGSAGVLTAARLAARDNQRVLLLEAGGDQPAVRDADHPLGDASRLILDGYNWDYRANLRSSSRFDDLVQGNAAPAEDSERPRALWERFPYQLGKVVGGGSAVNGAIAMRGLPRDFADWSAHGVSGWAWDDVLPYYKDIETDADLSGPLHGDRGPLPVHRTPRADLHPLDAAFWRECNAQGIGDLDDLNSETEAGVGAIPSNSVDGERMDAATTFLADARSLPNLELRPHTRVSRVLFDGNRAVGVEVADGDTLTPIRARHVVLSAGAVGTPAILIRSGVCRADLSRALGVTSVVDLPGVGENLADHPSVVVWSRPHDGVCTPGLPWRTVAARTSSGLDGDTDIQIGLLNNVESPTIPGFVDRLGWPMVVGISVMLLRPLSRGRVFLDSADPYSRPVIELGLGTAEEDVDRLCHGVRKAWSFLRSPGMSGLLAETQFWSDRMVGNDRILRSGVRNIMNPGWHATGSARMGAADDPMAVTDGDGRVHGTENLRIVDASLFPSIPSAPTNLTTLMLAEKIAGTTKD